MNPPVQLAVTTLTLGTPTTGQFSAAGQDRYYQVNVTSPGSLRILLDSAASSGGTELYLSQEGLPTPWRFEFASRLPGQPDQAVTVPTPQPGTYYILVRSVFGAAAGSSFTVTASQPGFGIQSISRLCPSIESLYTDQGGN